LDNTSEFGAKAGGGIDINLTLLYHGNADAQAHVASAAFAQTGTATSQVCSS